MTAAGEILWEEIRRAGPITFHRFMEVALYHPEHGYYRRPRDPFGKGGDFFTAEQMQPVFGILIEAYVRRLYGQVRSAADFVVVELGAGRGEMAQAFSEWLYVPVDIDAGDLPKKFHGVVFCNEFFDALPVHAAVYEGDRFRERRVALAGERFVWETGDAVPDEVGDYLMRYFPRPEEGFAYEANLDALKWVERIASSLESGYLMIIDYGYTRAEWARFPAGTLMGYRRHTARENVLEDPGERDITAHVNFTALQEFGDARGLESERFETLGRALLEAGEADQFAAALDARDPAEELRRRMQLKTLLVSMGESFRVLVQKRRGADARTGGKSPKQ